MNQVKKNMGKVVNKLNKADMVSLINLYESEIEDLKRQNDYLKMEVVKSKSSGKSDNEDLTIRYLKKRIKSNRDYGDKYRNELDRLMGV